MEQEIDLKDYVKLFKRNWLVVVFVIAAAILIKTVILIKMPMAFESASIIKIGKIDGGNIEPFNSLYAEVTSKSTIGNIEKNLNIDPGCALMLSESEGLIKVVSRGGDPAVVYAFVKAVVEHIISRHDELFKAATEKYKQNIDKRSKSIVQTENIIEKFKISNTETDALKMQAYIDRLTKLQLDIWPREEKHEAENLKTEILSEANLPFASEPKPYKRDMVVAGLAGFALAVFWVFIREYIRKEEK